MMKSFPVWVRPLGGTCRIRVDGQQNATWLLSRLGQAYVFKTSEPVRGNAISPSCTFQVAYSSQISRPGFEKLLASIPEVQVMRDPA